MIKAEKAPNVRQSRAVEGLKKTESEHNENCRIYDDEPPQTIGRFRMIHEGSPGSRDFLLSDVSGFFC